MADDCVFCGGALANERLAQSPRFLALADGYPASPGHALIVPRRHVVSLFDLTADEVAEAFGLLAEVRALIDKAYAPDAYNVGVNDGPAAGRTVHHLHIHLIPRYDGDVPDPRGGVRLILPGPAPDLWSSRDRTGYQQATSTLYGVAQRTGSPAARWAADYLAADPDRQAPNATPASAGAPEAPQKDLQVGTEEM